MKKVTYADPKTALKNSIHQIYSVWVKSQNICMVKDHIKSMSFKMPIEYESAIITYCQPPHSELDPCFQSLSMIARWFRKLKENAQPLDMIEEITVLISKFPLIEPSQVQIINLCVSGLYLKAGLPVLAYKKLEEIIINKELRQKYQAIVLLHKMVSLSQTPPKTKQNVANIIQQHLDFTDINFIQSNVMKRKSIKMEQFYNIGLCLKKNGQIAKSLKFFRTLLQKASTKKSKLIGLTKINIAECYYELKQFDNGINMLQSLINNRFAQILPYHDQIMMKIELYKKSWNSDKILKQYNIKSFDCDRTNRQKKGFEFSKTYRILKDKENELMRLIQKDGTKNEVNKQKVRNNAFAVGKKKKNMKNGLRKIEKTVQQTNYFRKSNKKINFSHQKAHENLKYSIKTKEEYNDKRFEYLTLKSIGNYKKDSNQSESDESSQSEISLQDQNELIQTYQKVIQKSTCAQTKAQSYYKIAQIYHKKRRLDQAIAMYKQSIEQGNYDAYLEIGQIGLQQGKYRIAAEHIEKYQQTREQIDPKLQMRLFYCYSMNSENYVKVIEGLKKRLDRNPGDPEAHILLVNMYIKQKCFDKAIQVCEEYRQHFALNYQNHHILGILYKQKGKRQKAFDSFIKAIRLNPSSIESLSELNQMLQSNHCYEELLLIYRKMLLQREQNYIVLQIIRKLVEEKNVRKNNFKDRLNFTELVEMGDFFMGYKMIGQASYAYKLASKMANNSLIKQKLGNLAYFRQNYNQALQLYEACLGRQKNYQIKCKIGHIKLIKHEYLQALKQFQICLRYDQQNKGMYLHMIGQCKFRLKKIMEAIDYFTQSKQLGYSKEQNQIWISACFKQIKEDKGINKFKIKSIRKV